MGSRTNRTKEQVLEDFGPGRRFGEWTIIEHLGMTGRERAVLARCSCGTERRVLVSNLASGRSTKCEPCHKKRDPWCEVAKANGIKVTTYRARLAIGMDRETAATVPRYAIGRNAPDPLAELAESNGISRMTYGLRVRRGWDPERAATEPPRVYAKRPAT